MALQGAGGSLSPPCLLPNLRGAALHIHRAWEGLRCDAVRRLSAEHGYMLSADIWAELSRLMSPQNPSSNTPLSITALLCGFLCLFFLSASANSEIKAGVLGLAVLCSCVLLLPATAHGSQTLLARDSFRCVCHMR